MQDPFELSQPYTDRNRFLERMANAKASDEQARRKIAVAETRKALAASRRADLRRAAERKP